MAFVLVGFSDARKHRTSGPQYTLSTLCLNLVRVGLVLRFELEVWMSGSQEHFAAKN